MIAIECTRCLMKLGWQDGDSKKITLKCGGCGEKNWVMATAKVIERPSTVMARVAVDGQRHPPETVRRCWGCAKVMLFLYEFTGRVEMPCRYCRRNNVWTGADQTADEKLNRLLYDVRRADANRDRLQQLGIVSSLDPPSQEQIVKMMEERWEAAAKLRNQKKSQVAVGLRFDVFNRDGFRCRYCGDSAAEGALLHADHVVPLSKGGPTTMENLVTACMDCNIGKWSKDLKNSPEKIPSEGLLPMRAALG